MSAEPSRNCPQCGSILPSHLPGGLCPKCVMAMNMASETDFTDEAGRKGAQWQQNIPTPAELAGKFPALEILELLGRGGMGVVYKARQKDLDRVVALKILPPGVNQDPAFAERFAREAKALAKLNHSGIVTIHEFGRAEGLFYFLMEYVDGLNLRQLLANGRVSAREALAIVPQICDALQFAHDHGIVHRDIKPDNILLDRRGRVKVADFGLAKLVGVGGDDSAGSSGSASGSPASLTDSGKVMGTPAYMAPEQKEKPLEVDHRADIYALGVVFYQMLTGELPEKQIEPPSHKVQIDVRLDEVVLRALEKNPEQRYSQASAMKTQVETIVSQATPPPPPSTPGATFSSTPPPSPAPPAPETKGPRPKKLLIPVVLLGIAASCSLFLIYKHGAISVFNAFWQIALALSLWKGWRIGFAVVLICAAFSAAPAFRLQLPYAMLLLGLNAFISGPVLLSKAYFFPPGMSRVRRRIWTWSVAALALAGFLVGLAMPLSPQLQSVARAPSGDIYGTVVDDETGVPIAGAEVSEVAFGVAVANNTLTRIPLNDPVEEMLFRTETDANGAFKLGGTKRRHPTQPRLARTARVKYVASAPGYQPARIEILESGWRGPRADFRLYRTNAVVMSEFGPVVELVVDGGVDLDRGKKSPFPENSNGYGGIAETIRRAELQGIDLYYDQSKLWPVGSTFVRMDDEDWGITNASILGEIFSRTGKGKDEEQIVPDGHGKVYAFRTRDEEMGLLQVIGAEKQNAGIRVRFKGVRDVPAPLLLYGQQNDHNSLANQPQKMDSATFDEVLGAALSQPALPWGWQELTKRVQNGHLSPNDCNLIMTRLHAWMKRHASYGYPQPLYSIRELVEAMRGRNMISEEQIIDLVVIYHGDPHFRDMPRLRESQTNTTLRCDWRGWDTELFGFVLLNEIESVSIDEKVVHLQRDWNNHNMPFGIFHISFDPFAPGRYQVKCRIRTALVKKEEMAGTTHNMRSAEWPPAVRRWNRTATAEIVVYGNDAELVKLSTEAASDPAPLIVPKIIIRKQGGKTNAVVSFNGVEKISIPLAFEVLIRIGEENYRPGHFFKGPTQSSGTEFVFPIKPVGAEVEVATLVLTPNARIADEIEDIDHVWGREIKMPDVKLTRHDLQQAE